MARILPALWNQLNPDRGIPRESRRGAVGIRGYIPLVECRARPLRTRSPPRRGARVLAGVAGGATHENLTKRFYAKSPLSTSSSPILGGSRHKESSIFSR